MAWSARHDEPASQSFIRASLESERGGEDSPARPSALEREGSGSGASRTPYVGRHIAAINRDLGMEKDVSSA